MRSKGAHARKRERRLGWLPVVSATGLARDRGPEVDAATRSEAENHDAGVLVLGANQLAPPANECGTSAVLQADALAEGEAGGVVGNDLELSIQYI